MTDGMSAIRKRVEKIKREALINDLCNEYKEYLEEYSTYSLQSLKEGETFIFQERVLKDKGTRACCDEIDSCKD